MAVRDYNGYSWKQRERNASAFKRAFPDGHRPDGGGCDLCGNPECQPELHSEDYSEPYSFEPPKCYWLCKACHLRLHKRFNEPKENWALFLIHLRTGGYASEFTKLYPVSQRGKWQTELAAGREVVLPRLREREIAANPWWEKLTLDPISRIAAWARPRPLRPRPDISSYRQAIEQIKPSTMELAILRCHANSPKRSATIPDLAARALDSNSPSTANLAYGAFAHRLCDALPQWKPDTRKDGSPIWMSVLAEGWEPEGKEFEWVLISQLWEIFSSAISPRV